MTRSTRSRLQLGGDPVVLMFGSGLHRHLLGATACDLPLASWSCLIRCTADVAEDPTNLIAGDSMAMVWERLVPHGTSHGFRSRNGRRVKANSLQGHETDKALRKVFADVLKRASRTRLTRYEGHPWIASLLKLMKHCTVQIADFNFDRLLGDALGVCWNGAKGVAWVERSFPGKSPEFTPLFRHSGFAASDEATYWKFHDHLSGPGSLRLGLRDFVLKASAYRRAVDQGKALRSAAESRSGRSRGGLKRAGAWVFKAIPHEWRVIGLGVGADEWGLRWLLIRRVRNAVGHPKAPPAVRFSKSGRRVSRSSSLASRFIGNRPRRGTRVRP